MLTTSEIVVHKSSDIKRYSNQKKSYNIKILIKHDPKYEVKWEEMFYRFLLENIRIRKNNILFLRY